MKNHRTDPFRQLHICLQAMKPASKYSLGYSQRFLSKTARAKFLSPARPMNGAATQSKVASQPPTHVQLEITAMQNNDLYASALNLLLRHNLIGCTRSTRLAADLLERLAELSTVDADMRLLCARMSERMLDQMERSS